MLKRVVKKKPSSKRYALAYDWGVSRTDGVTRLNGVGAEMLLTPVKLDPDTLQPHSKSKFTKDEWSRGTVSLHWLWPGHRVKTLLDLLRAGKLVGQAELDVACLKTLLHDDGKVHGAEEGDWAEALTREERRQESALRAGGKYREEGAKAVPKKKSREVRQIRQKRKPVLQQVYGSNSEKMEAQQSRQGASLQRNPARLLLSGKEAQINRVAGRAS